MRRSCSPGCTSGRTGKTARLTPGRRPGVQPRRALSGGTPGETDADHRTTVALVEALPFTYLHVFPFSVRPDAPAAKLREQLPAAVVRDRARELRELGDAKQRAYRASRLGQSADGVVSGHGEGKVELLTQDYLSVYLPIPQWNGCPRCEVTVR